MYNDIHMGSCAEQTAEKYQISRDAQDEHAIESYTRAEMAVSSGAFHKEIIPVVITSRNGQTIIAEDEEYKIVDFKKLVKLKGAFEKNGTVTAGNSSTLNDGASAVVLMDEAKAKQMALVPLARILSFADAACEPKLFTTAPSLAIPIALKKAGLTIGDIDLFEINEAFSVVIKANEQILGLDPKKVNIFGGGVSMGHPIGSSGSRIVVSLVHALKKVELYFYDRVNLELLQFATGVALRHPSSLKDYKIILNCVYSESLYKYGSNNVSGHFI